MTSVQRVREWVGGTKMAKWDKFQDLTWVTRRGKGVIELEYCGDVTKSENIRKSSETTD